MLTEKKLAEYISNIVLCVLKGDRLVHFTIEVSDSDGRELVEKITVKLSEDPPKISTVIFKTPVSDIQNQQV